LKNEDVFGFAGLWESWRSPNGEIIKSCSIITTRPNELVREIHDRMPVILHPEDFDTWLQGDYDRQSLEKLLIPYPADEMKGFPVSTAVNKPENDSPACIDPV
jgi:putative SOS response-associated peptidase YedK